MIKKDVGLDFKSFLSEYLSVPSPSGFEFFAQKKAKEKFLELMKFSSIPEENYDIITDDANNLALTYRPYGSDEPHVKVAFYTHADEIGAYVSGVDPIYGILYITAQTSSAEVYMQGDVHVLSSKNGGTWGLYTAITAKQSALNTPTDSTVQLIPKNKESAELMYDILIGAPAVMARTPEYIRGETLISKAIDNRIGFYIASRILFEIINSTLNVEVTIINASREEIGHQGIKQFFNLNGHIVADYDYHIVLDTTSAHNFWNANKKAKSDNVGDLISVGKGMVITNSHKTINQMQYLHLMQYCMNQPEIKPIPYQHRFIEKSGITDADIVFLQTAKALLIQLPIFGMHTGREMASSTDIVNCVNLLSGFIQQQTRPRKKPVIPITTVPNPITKPLI